MKRILFGFLIFCALGLLRAMGSQTPVGQDQATTEPSAIFIIRHAEKPDSDDDPNLTPRGYERAKALADVIPKHFCRPDFIWATARSRRSNRPFETVTPL